MFTVTRDDTDQTIDLDDQSTGWIVTQRNYGFPEVRESVVLYPDNDGIVDATSLFGKRVVSITGYITGDDVDARALTMRAYAQPRLRVSLRFDYHGMELGVTGRVANLDLRKVMGHYEYTFQWVCHPFFSSDEQSLAANLSTAGVLPKNIWPIGWPLTFNAGSSSTMSIVNSGQVPLHPTFVIYGEVTSPAIINMRSGQKIAFQPSTTIAANESVEINMYERTAYRSDGTNMLPLIDFGLSEWFNVDLGMTELKLEGVNPSGTCQMTVNWANLYT